MSGPIVRRWLLLAADAVAEERGHLGDLDAAIGDGDHGINLDRGFRLVRARLDAPEAAGMPAGALVEMAGRVVLGSVGGASGALYGRALVRAAASLAAPGPASGGEAARGAGDGARALPERHRLDAAVAALTAAVESVSTLGRSEPGQKTMLDALVPALDVLRAAAADGARPTAAFEAAATAAELGAAATIPLLARRGRASYLGERSIGHQDPGATSSALILRALALASATADGAALR